MSSTAENPSAGRTGSCPYSLASPGMSPRKSRTGGPTSFKSTPPLPIAQTRAHRRFRAFRPLLHGTLVILFLDRKNALIKDERQQRGTIDYTPVYTRDVVKRALDLGASALILVHTHPSGDPTPSGSDISVTNDIIKIAAPLAIKVYDHLIIGRGRHASLRELG